jgi:hypothetical protein
MVLSLGFAAGLAASLDVSAEQPFAITSISVQGTDLVLSAQIPPGMEAVTLQERTSIDTPWKKMGIPGVTNGFNQTVFTLPKPDGMHFFRLKAAPQSTGAVALVSGELNYVPIEPLGPELAESMTNTSGHDALFHFKGMIDGSDRIVITREGALWEHVNWDWPQGPVIVNHVQWLPRQSNYLSTTGKAKFLPERFSLDAVTLEVTEGRDVVALERANDKLIVWLDDVSPGFAPYEFTIHFDTSRPSPTPGNKSVAATLRISAEIDGSDLVKITRQTATWEHLKFAPPEKVRLNDTPWSLLQTNVLRNEGANQFLPSGVDFSTARIVERKGRDLATMWSDKDAVWIRFADNPNGRDWYELEIAFGHQMLSSGR